MDNIKSTLESVYNHRFKAVKRRVPQSIKCIVDQFVKKGWITNVQYYASECGDQLVIFGETKLHHDVFYMNPLTQLLWEMGCFVAPNRHCKNMLGEEGVNHIIIEVKDIRWLLGIEKKYEYIKSYEGVEALAAVVKELFNTIRRR